MNFKNLNFMSCIMYVYMSFKNISLEEYRKLLKNKKRMFDMTFPTPEILNKYRDSDKNIN